MPSISRRSVDRLAKLGVFMCKICLEWELGKLTNQEARRNLGEMINVGADSEEESLHYWELMEKLIDEKPKK